jgi:hypothetical protein
MVDTHPPRLGLTPLDDKADAGSIPARINRIKMNTHLVIALILSAQSRAHELMSRIDNGKDYALCNHRTIRVSLGRGFGHTSIAKAIAEDVEFRNILYIYEGAKPDPLEMPQNMDCVPASAFTMSPSFFERAMSKPWGTVIFDYCPIHGQKLYDQMLAAQICYPDWIYLLGF